MIPEGAGGGGCVRVGGGPCSSARSLLGYSGVQRPEQVPLCQEGAEGAASTVTHLASNGAHSVQRSDSTEFFQRG